MLSIIIDLDCIFLVKYVSHVKKPKVWINIKERKYVSQKINHTLIQTIKVTMLIVE